MSQHNCPAHAALPATTQWPCADRARLVSLMIELAVHDAAEQTRDAGVTPTFTDPAPLWGITWRIRSAAWMLTHRRTLDQALS